jgi:hypothetical protein
VPEKASVADRLESLARDRIRAIEALQDFQVFTGHSYDRYSKMVAAGHIKESITNTRTDTSLPAEELAKSLLRLLDTQLPAVCLYELIALLEAFEADLLRLLRDAARARPSSRSAILNCALGPASIGERDFARISELKATRNVCLHNQGIADDKYIGLSGKSARAVLGVQVPVTRPYVYEAADFTKDLVRRTTVGAGECIVAAA